MRMAYIFLKYGIKSEAYAIGCSLKSFFFFLGKETQFWWPCDSVQEKQEA